MTEEKKFPLEKILTASAADYCKSARLDLDNYNLVGVNVIMVTGQDRGQSPDLREEFAKEVARKTPEAVRVTDYVPTVAANNYQIIQYASGTALVPKSDEELSAKEY